MAAVPRRRRGLRPHPVRLVTPAVISTVAYAQRTGQALAARGFDVGPCRAPMGSAPEDAVHRYVNLLEALGYGA